MLESRWTRIVHATGAGVLAVMLLVAPLSGCAVIETVGWESEPSDPDDPDDEGDWLVPEQRERAERTRHR